MGLFSTLLHNRNATESSLGEIAASASASATTKSDLKSSSESSSSSGSNASELPTIVQLFTRQPIPLITDTASQQSQQQQPPSFAALHYTAVQCLTELSSAEQDPWGLGASLRGSSSNAAAAAAAARRNKEWLVPDLGVWNVQVPEEENTSHKLLDSLLPLTRSNTFCIVVDCNSSINVAADLSQVEPSITKIQQALVRLLIQKYKGESPTTTSSTTTFLPTQTTSLYDLRSVQFGLGDQDESAAARIHSFTATAPEEGDRSIRIALQICVQSPRQDRTSSSPVRHDQPHQQHDYKTQQYQKVLLYHLHKYAAALHASLVFVADPLDTMGDPPAVVVGSEQSDSAEALQPTVTTAQLPLVWKALAQGKPVWKYATMEAVLEDKLVIVADETLTELPARTTAAAGDSLSDTPENDPNNHDNNATVEESIYSLIYGPDNHNTELIESVLQRNANYPGHWDVATDSVWKILPPTLRASSLSSTTHRSNSNKTTAVAGDVTWLTELRDSIKGSSNSDTAAAGLQTPPRSKEGDNTDNKTPNDAAVSSFFQGLLS